MKISVIYWSGTGNTEAMAMAIAEGIKAEGVEVRILQVSNASLEDIAQADAIAFGCPSMGAEVLEEDEMEPFVTLAEAGHLTGKFMGLFGSYGWGDGQWMRNWVERMNQAGAKLVSEGLIIQETPSEAELLSCNEYGRQIVRSTR